jgi:antitoxin VapB
MGSIAGIGWSIGEGDGMLERKVSLFRNGANQAVRIPREFELPGTEAIIRQDGRRLIIEPIERDGLLALLARLEPIDEEWPEIDDPPPEPVEL